MRMGTTGLWGTSGLEHLKSSPHAWGPPPTPCTTTPSGRDHPRMRGDHVCCTAHAKLTKGSSPHARGPRRVAVGGGAAAGIIPACAGTTSLPKSGSSSRWGHPRMRGDHSEEEFAHAVPRGSSPHARGPRFFMAITPARAGIIPACAGTTPFSSTGLPPARDHPRMREDHDMDVGPNLADEGSSPHARGPLVPLGALDARGGIIPACAGTTHRIAGRTSCRRDHPRMRGDHRMAIPSTPRPSGSSPHARGPLRELLVVELGVGIIPACAGTTTVWHGGFSTRRDHPRLRGDHRGAISLEITTRGSSPPTRGPRADRPEPLRPEGIIPACAGTTVVRARQAVGLRDHPRLRGDHQAGRPSPIRKPGSSPPPRGPLIPERPPLRGRGIIPAYAGTTTTLTGGDVPISDHPRLRGDHGSIPSAMFATAGSSPPTRGPPRLGVQDLGVLGIIPAYAGTTAAPRRPGAQSRDHPRLREDHCATQCQSLGLWGSSPPTRGPQSTKQSQALEAGIIPRLRGDHPGRPHFSRAAGGSSPPTRGPPLMSTTHPSNPGIIPAYAGTTSMATM